KVPGAFILQENLFDLKSSMEAIFEVGKYLKSLDPENFPQLYAMAGEVNLDHTIKKEIDRIIDEKGNIRDNASDKLKEIRTRLRKLSGEIDRSIRNVLNHAKKSGWVNPGDDITFRNGRLVIPVPATHKRRIHGFIQDESATGQTVFIEPAEALEANNEIRELQSAEKREIVRILTNFTNLIRPEIEEIKHAYYFLGLIDFVRAKAKLAIKIEGVHPLFNDNTIIEWWEAKHPLLLLAHQKQKKDVVPLKIKLDAENRILIISGPNAGGKSVCLKTVGLLQYMLQCGLLIPVRETSETGIFKDIFIDIGDEQSIENDLSTYTSHLKNMRHFAMKANNKTLFLIDEFGTGTEPQLGGAIAESVLEHLNKKKAFGVITTHYANLKLLADKTDGLINGAMLFDTRQMQPLFALQIGNPGSSFAFEIAKRSGFPWYILKNAEKKVGKSQLKFDQQLQQLEIEKKELVEKKAKVDKAEKRLEGLTTQYNDLLEELSTTKGKLLKDAKKEATEIISQSNRLIENTIKEIKEAQADKAQTKVIREKLKAEAEKLDKKKDLPPTVPKKKAQQKKSVETKNKKGIFVGNRVRISPQKTVGEVTEIMGNTALVSFGSVIMKTPLNKIVNVGDEELHEKALFRKSNFVNIINEMNDKMTNFKFSLDLRGQRAEEALSNLQKYIDDALLLNVKEVKILHGKGDGILRDVIRQQLQSIKEIRKFNDEHIERGGHGITVVTLK
nr:Smr/MutS family protein [Bacteroidota bacterium]